MKRKDEAKRSGYSTPINLTSEDDLETEAWVNSFAIGVTDEDLLDQFQKRFAQITQMKG